MPNYPASANALTYADRPYSLADIADPLDGPGVSVFESEMEELDYEQPRALWEKVFDAGAKERFVEVSSEFLRTLLSSESDAKRNEN